MLLGKGLQRAVERCIVPYSGSLLEQFVDDHGPYVIKFVSTQWAADYQVPSPLKISDAPALTWGTATYVTPLAFPLSSALYGRIGLVSMFDPSSWSIFDATQPRSRAAYINWARNQISYSDLLLTVHSTEANHLLRNKFREDFKIDCVLFHPDQEAEIHTDRQNHVWMAVTDWIRPGLIRTDMSQRLGTARFTVLIDEEFELGTRNLPVQVAPRQIERVTEKVSTSHCIDVSTARSLPNLSQMIVNLYQQSGFLHVYIAP